MFRNHRDTFKSKPGRGGDDGHTRDGYSREKEGIAYLSVQKKESEAKLQKCYPAAMKLAYIGQDALDICTHQGKGCRGFSSSLTKAESLLKNLRNKKTSKQCCVSVSQVQMR